MLKFDNFDGCHVYLTSDMPIVTDYKDYIYSKVDSEGILFVVRTSDPEVVSYGYEQTIYYDGHKPGYIWSSRTGVINEAFGTDYLEVFINNRLHTISAESLKKYLPENLTITRFIQFDTEPYYKVVDTEEGSIS